MNVVYIDSESITFQGSREAVYKKYGGKGYKIEPHGGGNGNWLVTKKADVLVDGKSYRGFVLEHYERERLTEKLADTFRADLESGKITLPN